MTAADKALVREMYACVEPVAAGNFKGRAIAALRRNANLYAEGTDKRLVATLALELVEALPVTDKED